jgi:hypothetical protein
MPAAGNRALGWALLLVALGGAVASSVVALAQPDLTDRRSRTLRLPSETPVALRATVGDITVSGWDRPDIEIDILRAAPSASAMAGVLCRIEPPDASHDDLRVLAIQAGDRKDKALRGSIVVRAPFNQAISSVATFEGRIVLRELHRGAKAVVDRGSIDATALGGRIRLETTIGNIHLDRAALSNDGVIRLRTFNGNVDLGFASRPDNARILALALGGTIRSNIPLTLKTGFGPRFGETTIGRGSPVVSIDVVKGDIRITRGGA